MCAQCWTIFHASRFGLHMSWITFFNDILVELSTKYSTSQSSPHSSPYMTFALAHKICFWPQSCLVLFGHLSKGLCSSWFFVNKFFFGATHQHTFFVLVASYSLVNPYNDVVTFCKWPTSPQWQTPMYTTFSLFDRKCNIMLSLKKSWKIPTWCIAFIIFMNVDANFTQFCLKATSCVHPSISSPFATIKFNYP
jgi:hypothetical protein